MINLDYGLPGQGKSYLAGKLILDLLQRNIYWHKKNIIKTKRFVATNIELSKEIQEAYEDYLIYWNNLDKIPTLTNCDVVWDDMGWYIDARKWEKMPDSVVQWLRTHEHNGIEIYGNCQDTKDIDVAVRKLITNVREVRKIYGSERPADSKPPIKKIKGLISHHRVSLEDLEKEKGRRMVIGRLAFWKDYTRIKPSLCKIYATTQKFSKTEYPPFDHYIRKCSKCTYEKTYHI